MQNLALNGYTKQEVMDVLHYKYGQRVEKFRFDLLDKNDIKKATLDSVISGEVSMQYMASIKRTATFKIEDNGIIDWLNDRIQPFFMLQMPKGDWIEWPLGIFLLSSPIRIEENNKIYREIEAYDGLQILKDDKFTARYTIPLTTNYYQAVLDILQGAGITKFNIQQTDKKPRNDKEYEPGTEKLTVINDLLSDLNYTPLWVDEQGYFTSQAYKSPSVRGADYIYADDELSIIHNGFQDELDLFSVPNSWVMVATNAETDPLVSSYTNSNPSSITSTVSRGRTIVEYTQIDNIADQEALDDKVQRKAFEASQIYGHITYETALMPMHSYNDILHVKYSYLNINDKYSETSWTMPLELGGRMKHEARRVVNI